MRKPLLFCLLAAGCLPLLAGCWESRASLARRMKEQSEKNAQVLSSEPDPDSGKPPPNAATARILAADPENSSAPFTKVPVPAGATSIKTANKTSPTAPQVNAPPTKAATSPSTGTFVLTSTPVPPLSVNATLEQRRARTIENLAKLYKALNAYSDRLTPNSRYVGYPATRTLQPPSYPPMSWRVAILPFLGYDKLFGQYQPNEPWDSPSNMRVLAQIPAEYQSAERRDTKTNYLLPLASSAAFGGVNPLHRSLIDDPLDKTLILLEVDDSHAVEWTRPEDLPVEVAPGTSLQSQLSQLRGDGFFAVLASGRVCRIKPDVDDRAWRALFTISGEDDHFLKDAIQTATAIPATAIPVAEAPIVGDDTPTPTSKGTPPSKGGESTPQVAPGAVTAPSRTSAAEPVSASSPTPPLVKMKFPVPSESELAAARTALKKLYADEYKKAIKDDHRDQLAAKLAANSRDAGDDLTAVYELLRMSRDLYAQSGKLTEALKLVSQLEEKFDLDGPAMRLETITLFQKSPDADTKHTEVLEASKKLLSDAIREEKYDIALEALKISRGAAKRGDDTDKYLTKTGKKQAWLEAAKRAYSDFSKAEARFAAAPNDPQTNQIIGSYNCLVKGRWDLGLRQLAKANDLKLRFLAKLDLSSSKSPEEIFDLANQYWDLAEHKPDLEEQGLKLRAAYWYARASKELPDGLDKIKSRKRLAEILKAYGKEETEKATGHSDIPTAVGVGGNDE